MTHAAKLSKEEGVLDFREDAATLHNKVSLAVLFPLYHKWRLKHSAKIILPSKISE